MKIIVGLGNPEPEYDITRHNIGFMCVNEIAKKYNLTFSDKFNAKIAETFINGEKILLVKPYTYMNKSGEVVRKVIDFYDVDLEDVIVIYDDLAFDFGSIKIKYSSSHGGHNGIKNIISQVKSQDIFRIKVGINSPFKKQGKDFVLARFSKEEQTELSNIFTTTNSIVQMFIEKETRENIMNKYN